METPTTCSLDPNVVNLETIGQMENIALSIFASACGKNRGAFVLDPPDGNTYGWYVLGGYAHGIYERDGAFDSWSSSSPSSLSSK